MLVEDAKEDDRQTTSKKKEEEESEFIPIAPPPSKQPVDYEQMMPGDTESEGEDAPPAPAAAPDSKLQRVHKFLLEDDDDDDEVVEVVSSSLQSRLSSSSSSSSSSSNKKTVVTYSMCDLENNNPTSFSSSSPFGTSLLAGPVVEISSNLQTNLNQMAAAAAALRPSSPAKKPPAARAKQTKPSKMYSKKQQQQQSKLSSFIPSSTSSSSPNKKPPKKRRRTKKNSDDEFINDDSSDEDYDEPAAAAASAAAAGADMGYSFADLTGGSSSTSAYASSSPLFPHHDLTMQRRSSSSTSRHFSSTPPPPRPLPQLEVLFSFGDEYNAVSITNHDLATCDNTKVFLNDSLIEFYLKRLVGFDTERGVQCRVHVFSSFLYPKLAAATSAASFAAKYRQVARWTSGVDVFDRALLLFPIHQGLHWSLCTVGLEADTAGVVLTLDSYNDESTHRPQAIAQVIRQYLSYEYHYRKVKGVVLEKRDKGTAADAAAAASSAGTPADEDDDEVEFVGAGGAGQVKEGEEEEEELTEEQTMFTDTSLPLTRMLVPHQQDGVNCGLHLLNNAKTALQLVSADRVPADFEAHLQDQCSQSRFTTEHCDELRKQIADLIKEAHKQEKELRQILKQNKQLQKNGSA